MSTRALRNALIFTPTGRIEGDLLIEDGRIQEIGALTAPADEDIDLNGLWLWPGAIDAHVHFRDPGLTHKEDFLTGSQAAVSGGVTTVFDMPNTRPSTTTVDRLNEKRALIAEKTLCNFGLFFGANPDNLDEILATENIPALKIFMADSTGDLLVDQPEDLERIFAAYEGRISVHAESQVRMDRRREEFAHRDDPAVHSVIRDATTAAEGVDLATSLASRHGRRLHILHLSTREELQALRAAREALPDFSQARFTAEVCPHHLFLDVSDYERWGTRVQMNPPLRSREDRDAMWTALSSGELQIVATDHAPHGIDEKARPYRQAPSGVPGVETMVPLMLDAALRGFCEVDDVLRWLTSGPASIYDVVDRGTIMPGYHADLVAIDPHLSRTIDDAHIHSRCGWSPYAGKTLRGWPRWTFVNGVPVYRRDDDGPGEFIAEAVGREVEFRA